MKAFRTFFKKDWTEQLRSGRLTVLGILFCIFGIMNPAVAKLTPWLMETFAESLAESGMTVTAVTVDAMTSWTQFFKNIPMALIAFVLMESGILTRETQTGSLILPLTKGLARSKVVLSKALTLGILWTAGYWICFAITYLYNDYFWDNSIALHLGFSVTCWWLMGLWVVMSAVLFSMIGRNGTGGSLGAGCAVLGSYLLGLVPKVSSYVPTRLMDCGGLLVGVREVSDYTAALIVTLVLTVASVAVSIPVFNQKQL